MSLELIDVPAGASIRACFTTRAGGVSTGPWAGLNLGSTTGDDRAAVRANRRLLCDALELDHERATLGYQVHGPYVRRIDAPSRPGRFAGALSGWPAGDGLATARPGIGLVVLGADCLPVLMWRTDRAEVAAVHAGRRGLVAGVLAAAVAELGDPGHTRVAIGPGVGPCCYPVDSGVRERFADTFGPATVVGKALDLVAAARAALVAAGIVPHGVEVFGDCTSCATERFYSYRRDGATTGRHAGVIAVRESR
jgi:YfiH family protein